MDRLCFIVVLLGVSSSTIGTTVNPAPDINLEETVFHLKERAAEMESKFSSLENRIAANLEKRIKEEILEAVKDAETRALQEKNHLLTKMENEFSAKLEELQGWTAQQRDSVLGKVEEVHLLCEPFAEKLKTAEDKLKKVDNHLLMEILQMKPMLKQAVEKVRSVEEELTTALERERLRTHSLQVQMTEMNYELHSVDLMRKNMSSMADNLRLQLNDSLTNITRTMRIFENSTLNFLKDCANISYVSRIDEDLKNFEKSSKNEVGALRSEHSQRLEKLEERSALCDDVPEMKKTLTNHDSQLVRLNQHLWEFENSCVGEPPAVRSGTSLEFDRKPGSIVRYKCHPDFAMSENSTVRCEYGEWGGNPPICSFFDATFILVADIYRENKITCYSDRYSQEIAFSLVVDKESGADLPEGATTRRAEGRAVLDLNGVRYPRWRAFECGFRVDGTSIGIAVPLGYNDGRIAFEEKSKVAVIGDTVEIEIIHHPVNPSKLRWRRNGVTVPSWDGLRKVEIPGVQPEDAGIYECYEEGRTFPLAIRLIVRKCGKSRYGGSCEGECPVCYNGGVCHDLLGVCICPLGFTGRNCELACGEDHVGADCAKVCPGYDCKYAFFCKPDPFGCACFPGLRGKGCDEGCQPGRYGSSCKQECHCANGPESCNRVTGACSGGCSPGWSGQSCQIAE